MKEVYGRLEIKSKKVERKKEKKEKRNKERKFQRDTKI